MVIYYFKNIVYCFWSEIWETYFYDMNIDMVFHYCIVISFISWKIFKAYYGFWVLYVFPFPSAGHWPLDFGSWQSWYQSNGFSLLILKPSFCVFLHYCGTRLSNVSFVVIASSILRCVCFVIVSGFVCLVFFVWEGEHEMLPLLKQLIMLSSLFRMKLLLLLLVVEEEIAVVEECCFMLYLIYTWF